MIDATRKGVDHILTSSKYVPKSPRGDVFLMPASKRFGAVKTDGTKVICNQEKQHLNRPTALPASREMKDEVLSYSDSKIPQTDRARITDPTRLGPNPDPLIQSHHNSVNDSKNIRSVHEFIVPPKPEQQAGIQVPSRCSFPTKFFSIFTSHPFPDFCYVCQC